MEPTYSLAGALIGFLVGLTGVGGGSLMAPVLILMFGFTPAVAVGTDLWFATITKSVGGVVHHRVGSPDWKIVCRLALGSLPAAVATLLWLGFYHGGRLESELMINLLGIALLFTAILMMVKPRIQPALRRVRAHLSLNLRSMRAQQAALTITGGVMVGCVVTLTSVGAGALIAVLLAVLYPLRLNAKTIVGTDIIHAIPLTFVAALGHSWLGNVDVRLLANLLLGSIPGIVLGSFATGRISDNLIRNALATMLVISALKMLWS